MEVIEVVVEAERAEFRCFFLDLGVRGEEKFWKTPSDAVRAPGVKKYFFPDDFFSFS